MTECIDTGLLRAYLLDAGALGDDRQAVETHLATCPACRERIAELRAVDATVNEKLQVLAPASMLDSTQAWAGMQRNLGSESASQKAAATQAGMRRPNLSLLQTKDRRTTTMQATNNSRLRGFTARRSIFSALAAMLVLSTLAFPSVRAVAQQILQSFRVQSVVFVPVGADRLAQLQAIDLDPSSLFISVPHAAGNIEATTASTADEVAKLAGYTPGAINTFPDAPLAQQTNVYSSANISFTVDVNALRGVLSTLNINDVKLPDALGQGPISADIPPAVVTEYKGESFEMTLYQGHTPVVNLPAGVQMSELGKAALRVYGLSPDQADAMSKQIDWRTTLVVPFPTDLSNVKQVQVGSDTGLVVHANSLKGLYGKPSPEETAHGVYTLLYWQHGDRFYVLAGQGKAVTEATLLQSAKSIK